MTSAFLSILLIVATLLCCVVLAIEFVPSLRDRRRAAEREAIGASIAFNLASIVKSRAGDAKDFKPGTVEHANAVEAHERMARAEARLWRASRGFPTKGRR